MRNPTDHAPVSCARRRMLRAVGALPLLGLAKGATACEFFGATMRVYHPWTRAVSADAEHAIVIAKFDEVVENDRLIGIETTLARRAVLVTPEGTGPLSLDIPKGGIVELDEKGTHIRLLELNQALLVGRAYPMDLIFERGGVTQATLNVDYGAYTFSSRMSRPTK